jgi:hypothetical protein
VDGLNDILIPDSVPLWPPGPAWFVVGALVVAALVWLGWRRYRHYLQNAYRRRALALVDRILVDSRSSDRSPADFVDDVSAILKRVALVSFGRKRVADLSGDGWVKFLNETGGRFESSVADTLAREYGRPETSGVSRDDLDQLASASRQWIGHHRGGS